ncbi:MAG: sulfatase/phosphatase domain-containing protein, partial [Phycisphaerae bacterium]
MAELTTDNSGKERLSSSEPQAMEDLSSSKPYRERRTWRRIPRSLAGRAVQLQPAGPVGRFRCPVQCSWPAGLEANPGLRTPCSTLDILPTCCAAMGIDAPADRPIDGVDILPLLSDPAADRPRPVCYRFLDRKDKMFDAPTFAVMDGQWKFLTNLDAAGAHDQLYDMVADLGETTNVLDEHPDL